MTDRRTEARRGVLRGVLPDEPEPEPTEDPARGNVVPTEGTAPDVTVPDQTRREFLRTLNDNPS